MKFNLSIRIKKRSQPEWLCWMLIILPFFFGTMTELLRLPAIIKYVLDFAWIILLLMMMVRSRDEGANKKIRFLSLWSFLFLLYAVLLYIPNYQSGIFLLWGVRNNFRYYVAFAAFCTFLQKEDADDYLRLFDRLFWFNTAVMLFQYFVLNIDGDYLGGIFGVTTGCNGYTNIFLLVVLIRSAVFFLEGKESFGRCALKCLATVVVAALAEIKGFFVEAVVVIVMAVLLTNFSWRKVGFVLAGTLTILIGSSILVVLFPNSASFLSISSVLEVAGSNDGYTSTGDLNRLTAISMINERFFDNWTLRLFGFGLGNCEVASYGFLTTPFYLQYYWLHYSWLSTAFMYLETGWVGLVFFFGFFVLAYWNARKIEKNGTNEVKIYCRITKIMAIMCMMIAIYNSSLRTEAGYMAYFVLALPSIVSKNQETM